MVYGIVSPSEVKSTGGVRFWFIPSILNSLYESSDVVFDTSSTTESCLLWQNSLFVVDDFGDTVSDHSLSQFCYVGGQRDASEGFHLREVLAILRDENDVGSGPRIGTEALVQDRYLGQ